MLKNTIKILLDYNMYSNNLRMKINSIVKNRTNPSIKNMSLIYLKNLNSRVRHTDLLFTNIQFLYLPLNWN